jgi:CheY-like chemotaxis protein
MFSQNKNSGPLILVVEDVEETRDGIEKLLHVDGYRVEPARTLHEATLKALLQPPNLVLMCPVGPTTQVIQSAYQIRQEANLSEYIPIVIFCIEEILEGQEVAIGHNIYLTRLDNFNQLRVLLLRLLSANPLVS